MPALKIPLPVLSLLILLPACVPQPSDLPEPGGGTAAAATTPEGTREALKRAAEADPTGEALVRYGEWLLDHGREEDVLEEISSTAPLYSLHFLRGVAAERLGRLDEARMEYGRYTAYSATIPAPERFRIPGSRLQSEAGIRFQERGD